MNNDSGYEFRIITDLSSAEEIWRKFVKGSGLEQSLFSLWEFRYCFYKYFNFPLRFVLAIDIQSQLPVALLPAQFNTDDQNWEFFGGAWMEENQVFVAAGHEAVIPLLFKQFTGKLAFVGMSETADLSNTLVLDDYKYILKLEGYQSYQDFIAAKFSKKSQQTFKRKLKKIENLSPTMIYNRFEDFDKLFEYNLQTFAVDSSFHFPFRKEIYLDFQQLPVNLWLLSLEIAGEVVAVCVNIEYKGTFYYLNAGSQKTDYPNLGSYLIFQAIQKAIDLNCQHFDALMGAYNWKERWHFDKVPMYKLRLES